VKISKQKLVQIIKEELEDFQRQQDTVDDLAYELENLLGRQPTREEIERIRNAVMSGDIPLRSNE
jgi:CHASE3 domain sensor protein